MLWYMRWYGRKGVGLGSEDLSLHFISATYYFCDLGKSHISEHQLLRLQKQDTIQLCYSKCGLWEHLGSC